MTILILFLLFHQVISNPTSEDVFKPEIIQNIQSRSGGGGGEEASCESHFVMSDFQSSTSILVVMTIILTISLLFEWGKHLIEMLTPGEMRVVVHHFWSELGVLGFLSFSFFVLSQASVVGNISTDLFDDDETLKHIFEEVHMFFFICMIIFLLEVLGLLFLARFYFNKWRYLENLVVEEQDSVVHGWWNAQDVMDQRGELKTLFFRWFPFFEPYYKEIQAMEYLLFREQFINPSNGEVLPKDFPFCDYMILNLAEKLATIVDIHPVTWFCLEIVFIIVWLLTRFGRDETIIQIYALIGWFFLLLCFIFDKKVEWIRAKLVPTIPEGHPGAAGELELLQDEAPQGNQPRLSSLIGRTKSSQTTLFWFGENGENFMDKALSFMVLLGSIHSSIFIYGIESRWDTFGSDAGLFFFTAISMVPMLFTAFIFIPNVITKLVLVASIGPLKKKPVIQKVLNILRQHKTAKFVRILRLLKKKTDQLRKQERKARVLTEEKQKNIREAYRTFAPNSSTNNPEAYRTTMKLLTNIGVSKNESLFKLLARLDREIISYEEFQDEITNLLEDHESFEQMISRLFQCMTQDGQDTIDAQQVVNLLTTLEQSEEYVPPTADDLREFFDQVDSDHDGRISQQEFARLISKFSVLD